MTRRSLSTAALAMTAGLLVAACGFQLRTWDLAGLERVQVVGGDAQTLRRELTRALTQSGVVLTDARSDADVIVQLSDERESRRTASVSGGARVAEYEMSLAVSFGALDAEGEELVPTRTLRAERTYRLDLDNLIGSREEETLIVRELRADLVQRMVRSLGRAAERARAEASDAGA
ncbi:MAG: LPS assembly lipoprotein LptE [Gammaproteobacteria bacterium]|nr:LPS assembly lipoprotein LptE [Gammaproteobacteria bacterium]